MQRIKAKWRRNGNLSDVIIGFNNIEEVRETTTQLNGIAVTIVNDYIHEDITDELEIYEDCLYMIDDDGFECYVGVVLV